MKPAITWRDVNGREIAMLGDIEVGYVMASGGRKNRPRWLFALVPLRTAEWKTERSVERARLAVETMLGEWLRRAGLAD